MTAVALRLEPTTWGEANANMLEGIPSSICEPSRWSIRRSWKMSIQSYEALYMTVIAVRGAVLILAVIDLPRFTRVAA